MRQLKFRIWNNTDKEMYFSKSLEFRNLGYMDLEDGGEGLYGLMGHTLTTSKGIDTNKKEFIIQQFTGLKDKNGKEIYEGDRVRFGYTKYEDFFGEVIWLEDRASFGVKGNNIFETGILMDYMKYYFEVVGNIFQLPCNPDHNGECLVCDCWLSDCVFNKEKVEDDLQKLVKSDPMWQKPLSIADPKL